MSDAIGSFADTYRAAIIDGKSSVDSGPERVEGTEDRNPESEIINGYETESPTTERFGGGDDGNGGLGYFPDGRPRKRRARGASKFGGESISKTSTQSKIHLDAIDIGGLLCGIHAMLAEMTKIPELEIEKKEGDKLGKAVQDLATCYNHVVTAKTAAWIQICVVTGAIYGPRIAAIRIREKIQRENRVKKVNGTPAPFITPEPIERDGGIN